MTDHRMTPTAGRTALMVIDMQNAFCNDGGSIASIDLDISMLKAAIKPCARLIDGARAAGIPIIYTRYVYRADYADGGVLVKYLLPALGELDHLAAGTWDVEIVEELTPQKSDYVVDKNRPSGFYASGLEPILNGLDTDSLVVCGVTTNCCVETTVRDASQRDYKTFVVTDATGELEQERHDFAINTMAFLFAEPVTVDDVLQFWQ
ncbi:MAG: cysteine hydrolase [Rhodospirillaceae bacterium]|jgi:ureidoacrylate peracid hydrolase|nr:cysteine hydrolase [Rhodospirillaceae bacterium]MBT4044183.1 cysteine hydrolase [Rhodospirillaceae bacterium]MBT4690277.1 cysteine hydrolase [Rhodospirillaceae bacterium]MBT5526851.1 cysteine hydrolase [Rhodospirillaceae bacterium]MBT5879928.1 cysteine hydrolase [Rhodospirillaceae bacterium]